MNNEEDGWRRFLELCLRSRKENELHELLEAVLTPTERREISFRILILRELLKGEKNQRIIAKELPTSIANVTRGSNVLKQIGSGLRRTLES